MLDLGKVKPGATVRIPWATSSVVTNYSEATIGIYKDGAKKRASLSGLIATPTFDSLTGINLAVIDLADNAVPGFFAAGSEYFVIIGPVTVDEKTVYFPIARFSIEIAGGDLDAAIETLASQTSSALTKADAIEAYMKDAFQQVSAAIADIKRKTDKLRDYNESAILKATDAIATAVAALNNLSAADLRTAMAMVAAKIPTTAQIVDAVETDDAVLKELALVKDRIESLTAAVDTMRNAKAQRIKPHGFATIEEADAEAKARVLAGTYLQAVGCRDEHGAIAIRFLTPSGAWDLTTE